jgi:hypothetical protein
MKTREMKLALSTLTLILLASKIVFSQILLSENFDSQIFPPEAWSFDGHNENWKHTISNFAGGDLGEVYLNRDPEFNGISRFISPKIDIADASHLSLYFKYTLKRFTGNFYYGVATRTNESNWNVIWEEAGSSGVKKEINIELSNENSLSGFQFCFYFIGNSGKLKYWTIDDVILYNKQEHDITAKSINTQIYFEPGQQITPTTTVYNNGLNTETFNVKCNLYNTDNNLLFSDTKQIQNLEPDNYGQIVFEGYKLPYNNDMAYKIVVMHELSTDNTTINDTVSKYIYTYVSNTHKYVVLEMGTATWCSACPYAVDACDSMEHLNYNIALIEYHTNDNYSTNETEKRIQDYYSMYAFPTTYFDGIVMQEGAGPTAFDMYYGKYSVRKDMKTGVGVEILPQQAKNGKYNVKIKISRLAPFYNKNAILHVAVLESHIPEQWQNKEELNNLCRLFLPDLYGEKIDLINNTELTFTYSFETDESWNTDNMEIIAFIQDNDSHEILNADKAIFNTVVNISKIYINNIGLKSYPNPFNNTVTISVNINQSSNTIINIYDINGKLIKCINNSYLPKGETIFYWTPSEYTANGIYFIKAVSQNSINIKKILLNK